MIFILHLCVYVSISNNCLVCKTGSVAVNGIYSVVIPAYNAEKTIETCLASVVEQSLAPLEVLVIDDHSLDGTEAAVQRCEGRLAAVGIKLVYFRLAHNAGPSAARNKGLCMSGGDFIAFLDADDMWHKDKLKIVDRFMSTSNVGFVCHAFTEALTFDPSASDAHYETEFLTIYRMLLRNPAATPCTVVRKQHTLAFDESMRHCEDYDLWMQIAERAPILRLVGPPLTRLGRRPLTLGGLSGDTVEMRVGEARVYFNFCRRSWLTRVWLLPGLLTFSLLKHIYSRFRRWNL
jgi:teichuronic acid biosynthesis glycosyltransferase TuaG